MLNKMEQYYVIFRKYNKLYKEKVKGHLIKGGIAIRKIKGRVNIEDIKSGRLIKYYSSSTLARAKELFENDKTLNEAIEKVYNQECYKYFIKDLEQAEEYIEVENE